MQFIDKENDFSFALLYFGKNGFQPLFEFAAVFRARNERAQIERKELSVLQRLRNVPFHDTDCQPFCDSRFTYAGFTDKHGVVFCLSRKNTDHVSDLGIPSDDGIEFMLARPLHQIDAVFVEHVIGVLGIIVGNAHVAAHFGKPFQKSVLLYTVFMKQIAHRRRRIVEHSEENMFHGNIFILHVCRRVFCGGQRLIELLRSIHLRAARFRQFIHRAQSVGVQRGNVYLHFFQQLTDKAVPVGHRRKKMLFRQFGVTVFPRKTLRRPDYFQSFLRKIIIRHTFSPPQMSNLP